MEKTTKSEIVQASSRNWSVSEVKNTKYTITWTIDDFNRRYNDARPGVLSVESPVFPTVAGKNDIQWKISLYPKGRDFECMSYISLFLSVVSLGYKKEASVNFASVSIVNDQEEKTTKVSDSKWYSFDSVSKTWGWKNFIESEKLFSETSNLLPNGNLTLFWEMEVKEHVNIESIPFKVPENEVSLNLGNMFDSQKFGDVVFVADGQKINVYKGILSAHSPVFAAMFEHKMKEHKENRVEVTEMDPEVLKETLRFVHTGETSELDEMAEDLLAAADKYDLKRLKALCEEFLSTVLSVDTAANILMLSDKHNADQLKPRVLDFIRLNATAVMDTKGWDTLVSEQPRLINDAFRALALQKVSFH